jgi:hypothetical protein
MRRRRKWFDHGRSVRPTITSVTLTRVSVRVSDDPWLQSHDHLLSAGADVEHNTVALEVSGTDPTVPTTIAQHFNLGDQLTVTIDGTGQGNGGEPNG